MLSAVDTSVIATRGACHQVGSAILIDIAGIGDDFAEMVTILAVPGNRAFSE